MRLWWGVAALLWAGLSVAAAVARDGEETAEYVVGSAVGRLLGSLVIALVLRWAYVKVRGGDRRVRHPWTLVLAAAVSLITLGVRTADAVACREAERIEAADLLREPPGGYEVEPIPQQEARELRNQFPEESQAEFSDITGVVATKGDGGAAVYAITSASRRIEAKQELRAFQRDAPEPTERIDVDGEEGLLVKVADGTLVMAGAGECGAVLVVSPQEDHAREVVGALTLPED